MARRPGASKLDRNDIAMCGYNGRGIASFTTFGRVIAEHVMGPMNAPAGVAGR
ncbi:hypothetical protein HFO49_31640 [Rhizobium leguminosarum]|uniref:hypothetical protein n=1 Tax=Rhizobium leguminosarum TaxID=384 RepID=UPI001C963DE6|nr:hypothetical protein [Rhizobium leguminosarum]MBY5591927.1 hypothetical protein [Rhizobium leguminosarum]MBY5611970.1 hypothetical protein [Rhizobium leguminosarum]MBY5654814.1 hypothetical protein [Rhizobium leguminosarum]